MGTHVYAMEIVKVPRENTEIYPNIISFRTISEKYDTSSRYIDLYRKEYRNEYCERYFSTYTCREVLASDLSSIIQMEDGKLINNDSIKCLLGIRAMGETYTDVAKTVQKESGSANVSSFLSKLFGFPIEVTYGFTSKESTSIKFRASGEIDRIGNGGKKEVKKVNGHINLIVNMDEFGDGARKHLIISSILALLRETRIIGGILSGEITTLRTLIIALYKISLDRLEGKDTSYDCWLLGETNIEDALDHSGNVDGSDYYSMSELALFILAQVKGLLTHRGFGNTGPVYYMNNNVKGTLRNSLYEIAKKWKLDFQKISDAKEQEEDDDYDDE